MTMAAPRGTGWAWSPNDTSSRDDASAAAMRFAFGFVEDPQLADNMVAVAAGLTGAPGAAVSSVDTYGNATSQIAQLAPHAATLRSGVAGLAGEPLKARGLSKLADLADDPGLYGATDDETRARVALARVLISP